MQAGDSDEKYQQAKNYLQAILDRRDSKQAKRYSQMTGQAKLIATRGLIQRLRKVNKGVLLPAHEMAAKIDSDTIREIIDDALEGKEVYTMVNDDKAKDFQSSRARTFRKDK